ncbi:hypothetical protein P9A53_gp51 [Xanthomonas phage vB_Xar_IVIA-DoCa6]|uniref:Uncharacterized protein n=1 Tax=Xanthomonas phage vB_Xar_IVIA-DoCa6 TaxID=2975533 RepID=A0A9X9JPU2_9CAUD|nr:hypothetical protein P9A53_gp51 [Xanthomonas phage vB_Xar_IVIA-DoCa6]UYA98795.1 hypothetical protein IVIADoCa6_51 [Xanthomonas phage vB_Xar_IVIA-DoCa6]
MATIADTIRAGLADGKTNDEILAMVKQAHPTANTSPACVSYYRSKAKKAGGQAIAKAPKAAPKQKALVAAVGGHGYTVKGLKSFIGNEGSGYNASIYRDGKLVAFAYDDASGGCLNIEWKVEGEYELMKAYVHSLPEVPEFEAVESFVDDLVNDAFLLKDAAKLTKGKVAILKDGKLYTIKASNGVVTPQFLELVAKKNPTAKILNGLSDLELVAIMKSTVQ